MEIATSVFDRIVQGPTLSFFVLFAVLILGPRLAERVKLPAMVGLVLAGMAVGPHGFKFMNSHEIAMQAWGTFGLLYLMFSAGLELDFKLFARVKKAAISFALLSFAIPLTLGVISARTLGYAWAAAILMGSNWASHTLVTYPMLRQMGLARSKAVATVVGATAMTDTMALLVLTGVSASVKHGAAAGAGAGAQTIEIIVGFAILLGWTLYALPKLGRLFFARIGSDRSYRFVFAIAGFLSGAVLAEAAGIDGIVGAFFAGLGLNRDIPERSPLMDRVQFSGSSLFIPVFLVSVGLLLNPSVMVDPKTLLIALVFSVAVLGGKSLAAVISARLFKYSWPEAGVMAGLSGSQAAATLATTIVGAKLHLFNEQTVNAVLIVILVTLIVTPAMVTHFARRVTPEAAKAEALGSLVLVPVTGEASRSLFGLAGRLAASDNGIVVAASVATNDLSEEQLRHRRGLSSQAEEWLSKEGLESRSVFRVSNTVPEGVLQTMRGEGASLLVASWPFEIDTSIRETEVFQLLPHSPVPTLFANGELTAAKRWLVIARAKELVRPGLMDLELAAQVVEIATAGQAIVYVETPRERTRPLFSGKIKVDRVESNDPLAWAYRNAQAGDVLVFAGIDSALEARDRFPDFAKHAFLVAVAARGLSFGMRPMAASSGVVVGRSDTSVTSPTRPGGLAPAH